MDASEIRKEEGGGKVRRMAVRILIDLLLVGGGISVFILAIQGKVIFPASRAVLRTPESDYGWAFEDVRLPVGDKVTHGWFIPVSK